MLVPTSGWIVWCVKGLCPQCRKSPDHPTDFYRVLEDLPFWNYPSDSRFRLQTGSSGGLTA